MLGMRMPALLVQFVALGLVLAVLYVVLVLPALWVFAVRVLRRCTSNM